MPSRNGIPWDIMSYLHLGYRGLLQASKSLTTGSAEMSSNCHSQFKSASFKITLIIEPLLACFMKTWKLTIVHCQDGLMLYLGGGMQTLFTYVMFLHGVRRDSLNYSGPKMYLYML